MGCESESEEVKAKEWKREKSGRGTKEQRR